MEQIGKAKVSSSSSVMLVRLQWLSSGATATAQRGLWKKVRLPSKEAPKNDIEAAYIERKIQFNANYRDGSIYTIKMNERWQYLLDVIK